MVKKRFLFHKFRNRSSWVSASLLGMLLLGQAASVRADETKDFQVSDDDDDAEERVSDGNMNLGSTDLEMILEASDQIVGIRFRNINIPQGATILRAWIEFEADESDSGATNLTIHGEDIDDAPIFTNGNSNISNRTTTTASVSWSPGAWSTNDRNETPDLSSIVQEIVDRAGWASDNEMVFIITGSGARVAESHNGEDQNAPILRIEIQGSASTPGGALCWSVDDGNDNLRILDTSDGTIDTTIGDTGVGSIEAIAIDPNGLSIYAADADQLGRLNPDTAEFIRLIQPFGTGDDGSGNSVDFDDVDSLSFDSNGVLWGVNASGGDDELFQIDPDTGAFVPDAFGAGIDYVTVSGSGIGSSIDDIAIDPSSGIMYGADTNNSQLITINTTTGAATVVGGYGGTPDMEGIAFHFDGTLYGTALQQMFTVNTSTGAATQIGTGNTLTPGSDYEAFDCNYTALTRAVISSFTSQSSGSNVVVEWETASEEGTAGFYLYRFDSRTRRWRVMNEQILPALQGAPQGGRYRWLDETAPSDVDSQGWYYGLLEVEAGGRMAGHGPHFHQVGGSGDAVEPPGGFLRQVRRSARQLRRDAWRRQRRKRDATNKSPRRQNRGPALKIRASEKGLYYVDAVRMAQTLGDDYSVDWVLARIARQRVSLTRHGKDVA